MVVMEQNNCKQMEHSKQFTCALASRQVSVVALCFLMKPDGIVRIGLQSLNSLHSIVTISPVQ